jgi:hypothetical protein
MECLYKASVKFLSSRVAKSRHTTQRNVVKVGGQLDCLNLSTDVVVVHMIVEVGHRGMCAIVCSKDLLGLFDLVWPVNILDYRISVPNLEEKNMSDPPVMMASGASSRGSRNARRTPGLMAILSMTVSGTSRLMGIEKSVPSTSLSVSTTLTEPSYSGQSREAGYHCIPFIIRLVQETFQGTESTVQDEFQVAKLSLNIVAN